MLFFLGWVICMCVCMHCMTFLYFWILTPYQVYDLHMFSPILCWWEYKLAQPLCKTVWSFLKILKVEPSHDSAIPLLGLYPKEMIIISWRDTCTPMFIAALYTITNKWKKPKSPSVDKQTKKIWYVKYYSATKRRKFCWDNMDEPGGKYWSKGTDFHLNDE